MIAIRRCFGLAAALTALAAAQAPAQSLLANRGLGLEVEPQTTRSGSLGGVSLGLPGSELSWSNPAGAVGLPVAGLSVSFQLDQFSTDYAGTSAEGSTARFPLILAAFPFGERWVATAGFGSFLDQNWALERRDSLFLDNDTARVLDRIVSEGGVGRFRLGAGYRVLPRLSIGLGVDLFTGGVRRTSGRIFLEEAAPTLRCCQASWDYSGAGLLASADWNPAEAVSVSVAGSVGGTLQAAARDSASESASYAIPASLRVGASGRIASEILLAAGANWTGWSKLDGALSGSGGARDAWSAQGGVEWDALRFGERVLPIRLGGRYAALPFGGPAGGEAMWTRERTVTGGTGLVLGGGAATADVGVERGRRGGGAAFDESFWRVTLSVSVLGQ